MVKLEGQVLNPPTLIDGRELRNFEDYSRRRMKLTNPMKLKDGEWTFVYAESNYYDAVKVMKDFATA